MAVASAAKMVLLFVSLGQLAASCLIILEMAVDATAVSTLSLILDLSV